MKKSVEEGLQKAAELSSKLEALTAEKAQLEQELKDHQSSRETAKQDQEKAASIREKEQADFEASAADMSTNIAAMKGAIAALTKGLGLIQMGASQKAVLERARRCIIDRKRGSGRAELWRARCRLYRRLRLRE